MSPRFLSFMPFIFEWEGETFENDPDDPGGATKFGIDQRSHPGVDIRNLTKEEAIEIYWKEWLADGCDPMPSPYAQVFFNCAVNMGLGRAREFDKQLPGANWSRFLDLQELHYHKLAWDSNGNPTHFHKFLRGWLNRTTALRELAKRIDDAKP